MPDRHRQSSGRNVNHWLRRNVWLVAAATLLLIYGVFMVRTTMWTHAFGVRQEHHLGPIARDSNVIKEALPRLEKSDALRDEHAPINAAKQAEKMEEDARKELAKGAGEQKDFKVFHDAHTVSTTGSWDRLHRTEIEDDALYDDSVSLGYAKEISMAGATATILDGVADAEATNEDHKWAAFDDLSVAGEADDEDMRVENIIVVPIESDHNEPSPLPLLVARTDTDSDYLWTGVDKLPGAGEGTRQRASDAILVGKVPAGSRVDQHVTPAVRVQPSAFTSRRFDKSRLAPEIPTASIPFEKRHQKVFGYNATIAYLQLYTKPADSKEELFLFFTCSDNKGGQDDWTPNCAIARKKVYDAFAKSPSTNRLVTIYAGPREDWIGGKNAFTTDSDLCLKVVPTLMRWDGGAPGSLRSTWGVLVDHSIFYDPLLRYLFLNSDEQDKLLGKPNVETKAIVTLRGYAQYRAYMELYAQKGALYPLYLMMVSGRFQRNNRLWCPWCRQSELPVEYAFYAYAPMHAKLIIVETFNRSSEWRDPENEFKKDPQLAIKGVPWFYRVYPSPPGEPLVYQRIPKKFYVLEALQQVFEGSN